MSDIQKRKKKDGTWSYTARVEKRGIPRQIKTFPSMTLAKEWLKATETALLQGAINPIFNAKQKTVTDIIELFIKNELPKKKPKAQEEFKMVLTWFNKEIGNYSLATVATSVEILVKCRDKLKNKKKQVPMCNGKIKITDETLAPATVNKYLRYMSVVFEYCVMDLGILQVNPMSKVRKLKENNARVRYLQVKEISKLLNEAKKESYELFLCILISLLTGARKSEILNLTWNNIDFEYVAQTNKNKGLIKYLKTKNGKDRYVTIPPALYKELLNYKNNTKVRSVKNDYLFKSENGQPKETIIGKQFPKLIKKLGIENFRFHDLRHTHASWEAMSGVPQQITQQTLGHETPLMTDRYTHMQADCLSPFLNQTADVMLADWKQA